MFNDTSESAERFICDLMPLFGLIENEDEWKLCLLQHREPELSVKSSACPAIRKMTTKNRHSEM